MQYKILKEIQTRKEIYKTSSSDMISAYNREVETEKEYNGRQLLELLQNADDERSDEVQIELDTKKQTLTISNRGEFCTPFSFKGIRSLMISNLSSKTTKKYIGNKGLGFRSIINWSKKVIINSNGLDVVFSREIVGNVYDELFNEAEHQQIVEERNLPMNIKPIPFLAIPQVKENPQNDWTTVVSIEYKNKFLEDIQKQLAELKNEILLFLNSIQKLEVVIDGEVKQHIDKKSLIDKWTIYSKNELLPKELWDKENEEEYFDLKIALQDDLDNNVKELFAYFPTKIQINFPFIVHGTFELNSSRNELNDSPKNRYILKKLVELIVETAKEMTEEEVSYKALEMLSYTNPNNILAELGFYDAIDNAIEELEVFPCLDGKYRTMSDVVYANDLATFVEKTQHNSMFSNFLIPSERNIDLDQYPLSGSIDDELLNELSTKMHIAFKPATKRVCIRPPFRKYFL